MNCLSESALQPWVGIDEVVHLISIACNNTDKLTTIILKTFQKGIDSLSTK